MIAMNKSEAYKNLVKEAQDSYRIDDNKRCGKIKKLYLSSICMIYLKEMVQ